VLSLHLGRVLRSLARKATYIDYTIAKYNPDLFGLQELIFREEAERFRLVLPNMSSFYYDGPPLEALPYADNTLYWNNVKYDMVESGVVWLGPEPSVPWSSGFVGRFPRTFVWGIFLEKASGRQFYFSSTHYSNNGNCDSKIPSSDLVLQMTAPYRAFMPVVLLGDFNSALNKGCPEAYHMLVDDGYLNTHDIGEKVVIDRNNNQQTPDDLDWNQYRIDHIFVSVNSTLSPTFRCPQWIENQETFDSGLPASDHWAMVADCELW